MIRIPPFSSLSGRLRAALPSAPTSALLVTTAALLFACGTDELLRLDVEPSPTSTSPTATATATTTVMPTATTTVPPFPLPLKLEFESIDIDEDIDWLTDFRFLPDSSLLLLNKEGVLTHIALQKDETAVLGRFALNTYDELDCGAISLALDPDFEENGFIYVGRCTSLRSSGVFRLRFDADEYSAIPDSEVSIIEVEGAEAVRPWHNVGAMDFDADGNLFVLFGEKVIQEQAQNVENNLGTLVRIVPSREPGIGGYEPTPGNSSGDGLRSPDIYAYGLRSPWRGALDKNGHFWYGDVGSASFEEINVVREPGQNMGWPIAEGFCTADCEGLTDPLASWGRTFDHDYFAEDPDTFPSGGRVAWVSPMYSPDEGHDQYAEQLTDRVLFGDYCAGFMRSMLLDDEGNIVADDPVGHLEGPGAWRQGPDGYLYVVTVGRCQTDREAINDRPSQLLRAVPAR